MRSHADIVAAAGTARLAELFPTQSVHTITSWRQRGSIPSEHWSRIADAGLATLEELVSMAPKRASRRTEQAQAAAA